MQTTDRTALTFNQVTVVALGALALTLHLPWLAGCLGLTMLVGAARPGLSPLRAAYRALSPLLGLRARVVEEAPAAHHFAQGVGGTFLLLAGLCGLLGWALAGEVLTLCVILLALLNLTTRICVGCLLYFRWKMIRFRLGRLWSAASPQRPQRGA